MAIDFGEKRMGLAISDEFKMIARPIPTITVVSQKKAIRKICDITVREGVDTIVVGIPFYPSGDETLISKKVRGFLSSLKKNLPKIIFHEWDERYTSVEAEKYLREKGEKILPQSGRVDQISALIILQDYLNEQDK